VKLNGDVVVKVGNRHEFQIKTHDESVVTCEEMFDFRFIYVPLYMSSPLNTT